MAHGGGKEQDEGLPQALRVGAEELGKSRVQGFGERDPAFPGPRAYGLFDLVDDLGQGDLFRPELGSAGQQPPQLGNLADHGLDVLGYLSEVLGIAPLLAA